MPKGVTIRSERGSQYCSAVYQKLIWKHRLVCGMGKKGGCYDNAAMESWNHSFKVEAVHGERFRIRAEAKSRVFDNIEVYYLCPLGTTANSSIQDSAISALLCLKTKKAFMGRP